MKKKPTIATVASAAGVAVSTVSRYLNGHYVRAPVRARLGEVIASLGYSRSWTARNLSLGRRGCIAVVVDSSADPWFVQLLTGIEEELAAVDTGLMLASLELRGSYDPGLVLDWVRARRVDGLIAAKSRRRDRPLFSACAEARLPTVAVVPDEASPHAHVVGCDNVGAGVAVAQHLVSLGHRDIAFAGGPLHSLDSRHRLRGLRQGLEDAGVGLSEARVYSCGSWTTEAGEAFADKWLRDRRGATALVMANDALAFGFMRVAQQRGLPMPGELSIVGFDGLPQGALFHPALTTAAQPIREMGRAACRTLFGSIDAPGPVQRAEFPMRLLVRESTAPPAGAERAVPAVDTRAMRSVQA
jgi:DNA-binding LacI/PurR family transcriptional regulator